MSSPKKINKLIFLYILFVCTIGNIAILAASLLIALLMPNLPTSNMYVALVIVQDVILLALPIALLTFKFSGDIHEIIPIKPISAWNVIFVVMTALLTMPLMTIIAVLTSYFAPDSNAEITAEILSAPPVMGFIIMAVCPAIMEEFIFRGFIFGSLKRFGTKKAIMLSAFYFGLLHMNPYQLPYAFFAGIILALVVYYTGSLIASSIVHLIINGSQVLSYYSMSGAAGAELQSSQEALALTPEALIVYGIGIIIFGGLLALMLRSFIRYNKNAGNAQPFLKTEHKFLDVYVLLSIVLIFGQYMILN